MSAYRIAAASAAIILSACSTVSSERAGGSVTPATSRNEHFIQVTVRDVGGKPTIHVDVEMLVVRGPNHMIFWRIDNEPQQKYRFASPGIDFIPRPGSGQFVCKDASPAPGLPIYRCENPNTTSGLFKYAINVVDDSGTSVTVDPYVVND